MGIPRLRRWLWGCALVMAAAACTGGDPAPAQPFTPTPLHGETSLFTPAFATLSPALVSLQRHYEALSAAHDSLAPIWEGLARGDEVRCGEHPLVPDPAGIGSAEDADHANLAALLRRAAIALTRAGQLWQAECAAARRIPPPTVVHEGLLAVRGAGDALRQAEPLLSGVQ